MKTQYYHTPTSVQEYIHLAKDVNGANLIAHLKNYLPKNSTLLELGSGPGTDWEILSEAYQVTGSDLSKEFLKHLKSKHSKGQFLELDASTLQAEEQFHGIYSNKVLHHLTDEELQASIIRQHAVLHPDGVVCHSFWKGEGTEVFKGMFVNYHNQQALRGFFEPLFEVLLMESYTEFEEGDSILMIGRKRATIPV